MVRLNHKDLVSGVLIALAGLYVGYSALGFGVGNASRMGPGYMLMVIAAGMVIMGTALAVGSVKYDDPVPNIAWRPLLAVTAGMCAFAGLLNPFGLVPAVMLLVGLSSLGDPEAKPVSTLILAACVAGGMWLVFVYGLRIPLPAFALDV